MPTRDDILKATTTTTQRTPAILVPTASSPKITTLDISKGPPPANNGDIWIATNVDTNGVRWHFQYNANSSSIYKWEFIGGPHLTIRVSTDESTNSATFTDLATVVAITFARGGDYRVRQGCEAYHATPGTSLSSCVNAGTAARQDVQAYTANAGITISSSDNWLGVGAGAQLRQQYQTSAAGGHFRQRWFEAIPVRVA